MPLISCWFEALSFNFWHELRAGYNKLTYMKYFSYVICLLFGLGIISACQEDIAPSTPSNPGTGGSGSGGSTSGNDTNHNISSKYLSCLEKLDTNTLDIATWNIENFPVGGTTTIDLVEEIVQNMYPDVIAAQEIASEASFNTLKTKLDAIGYGAVYVDVRFGQDLAFFYKRSEITSISGVTQLYASNSNAFPRQPALVEVTHKSGLKVKLINIHLKARDDGKDRRIEASRLLKLYIDTNLSTDPVIVLGDFNDEIIERVSSQTAAFTNFLNDPSNYKFADYDIDNGPSTNWSYPSWPSHLDHLLITNELFSRLVETTTIKIEGCESRYRNTVSDHRPVMARFKTD